MTTEEAIKHLMYDWYVEGKNCLTVEAKDVEMFQEAIGVAITALRAQRPVKLDRSLWKGCLLCDGAKNVGGENITAYLGRTEDGKTDIYAELDEFETDFDYCPICGKPLTEEAWAELERRIGGNNGKTD